MILNPFKIATSKVIPRSALSDRALKNPWQEKTMPEDGDRLTNKLRSILCVNGRNGVFPPPKIYDEGEGCDEVFPGVLIGDM